MPAKAVLGEIKHLLGAAGFIDEPQAMQPHLNSWRGGLRGKSPLVALPATTAQVSEIVKICARERIGIVPQGGNTGLVGGAIPSNAGDEIVLCLSRMNKVRGIDTAASSATVEAGVVLQTLQEKAAEAGFLFPLSMGSQGSAQIGGAISTNAGGTGVLRYGNTRELVLGIEAVLADGEIISSLTGLRKDNLGYNLAQYFIGAEGTLGIVTAATLRLLPKPRQKFAALAAVVNAEAALDLLKSLRATASEYLSAFEIISSNAMELALKHIPSARRVCEARTPFYVLVELEAASQTAPLREMFEEAATPMLESGALLDAAIAESETQGKQFWHIREHISEALRKEGPGIQFDISLPIADVPAFLAAAGKKIETAAPGVILAPFGHIGDGNIHYNMAFLAEPADDLKKRIKEIVYEEVLNRRGSLSAEHGTGTERRKELLMSRAPAEIAAMKKIKRALDPDGLMNPGKVFE